MQKRHLVRITVSVIVEHRGKILFVRERMKGARFIDPPVGHMDPGETVPQAAVREVREETGYRVKLTHLVGIYHNFYGSHPMGDSIRFVFAGRLVSTRSVGPSEEGIEVFWIPKTELKKKINRVRKGSSRQGLKDYLNGVRASLVKFGALKIHR